MARETPWESAPATLTMSKSHSIQGNTDSHKEQQQQKNPSHIKIRLGKPGPDYRWQREETDEQKMVRFKKYKW